MYTLNADTKHKEYNNKLLVKLAAKGWTILNSGNAEKKKRGKLYKIVFKRFTMVQECSGKRLNTAYYR